MSADNPKRQKLEGVEPRRSTLPVTSGAKGLFARAIDRTTISVDVGDIVRALGYSIAMVIAALNAPDAVVETIETVIKNNSDLASK